MLDRSRDVYAEPSRIRKINHKGKYFSVEGPSIVEPSPQGTPLLYQAGSSASGVGFGAKHAEVVFMAGKSRSRVSGMSPSFQLEGENRSLTFTVIRFEPKSTSSEPPSRRKVVILSRSRYSSKL